MTSLNCLECGLVINFDGEPTALDLTCPACGRVVESDRDSTPSEANTVIELKQMIAEIENAQREVICDDMHPQANKHHSAPSLDPPANRLLHNYRTLSDSGVVPIGAAQPLFASTTDSGSTPATARDNPIAGLLQLTFVIAVSIFCYKCYLDIDSVVSKDGSAGASGVTFRQPMGLDPSPSNNHPSAMPQADQIASVDLPPIRLADLDRSIATSGVDAAIVQLRNAVIEDEAEVLSSTEIRGLLTGSTYDTDVQIAAFPQSIIRFRARFTRSRGADTDLSNFELMRIIKEGPEPCQVCKGRKRIAISELGELCAYCDEPATARDRFSPRGERYCSEHFGALVLELGLWATAERFESAIVCKACNGAGVRGQ